jgi:hypothetical protein
MQTYKKILLVAGICAVSLTVCYFTVLYTIPNHIDLNKYTKTIFTDIETQTGFKVSSENIYFKKSFSPFLKVHMYHTAILYPDNTVFLQVKEADLQVKLIPLLFKNLVIKDAEFTRPIVNVTLYKDYTTSLEKYANNVKLINTKGFKFNSIINDSYGKQYKIKFKDESINKTFYLEGDELILKDFKINEKAHLLMKGAIFENKKEYIKYDLDILTALSDKEHQFTFSPFKTIFESDVKGNIYGHIKIDKDNNLNGNIKVKDLSLKLKDIVSTNNNADILFKGKEAQIDAVFHTSKTDSAKINGKFIYGNKKYINFDTKANNINLENLIKIISSLSKVLNIKNPVNDISAKGLLNADFNITSDFKKLQSKGNAEIINAELEHKSIPYPVSGINAKVNFDNNNIVIEQAIAKVNNTPLSIEGKVSEDLTADIKVSAENLDLKILADTFVKPDELPVNILKGNLKFNSDIKGNLGKTVETNSNIVISNSAFVEKTTKLPVNAKTIIAEVKSQGDKYSGNINFNDFSTIYEKMAVKAQKLFFEFDNKTVTIPENKINILNSEVKIQGDIKDYQNNPAANMNFSGNIDSNSLANVLKPYINMPYKAAGKMNTTGNITSNKEKQNIKLELNANENNYISYLVIKELFKKPSVLNIECELKDKTADIKNISLNDIAEKGKKVITVNGKVKLDKETELNNVNVSIPDYITIATNFFGGEELSFKTDLILNKLLKNPDIKGYSKINYYNIKKYHTSVKNADASFTDNNIRLIAPNVQVNNSQFNMLADIIPPSADGNINITNMNINSLNLDLNSLFPMLYENRENFAKSKIIIKNGVATVEQVQVLDLKAKDLSCDFRLDKTQLKLSNVNSAAYSGYIYGKADYDLYTGMLNINAEGNDIDIKNSLYDLCKIKDNLSGRAKFIAKLSMMTGAYDTVIKTLNGEVKFNAKNGGMGTLGKFEYYLSAKNIFYHGFLNTTLNRIADALKHDKTEQFKEAKGNIIIQNAYLISDGIQTKGTKMSLYLRGKHNLITNQSNIDIYGRIPDDFRTKIGSFWNVSISEMISGQSSKNDIVLASIPDYIRTKIPELYNNSADNNLFKVNILGDISAVNSINSFEWVEKKEIQPVEEKPAANQEIEEKTETKIDIKEEVINTQEKSDTPDFSEIPEAI